jgi:hypothetical protein
MSKMKLMMVTLCAVLLSMSGLIACGGDETTATGSTGAGASSAGGSNVGGSGGGTATSWKAQTSGTTELIHDVHFVDDMTGWAVGDEGTILHTSDGGANWTAQSSGANPAGLQGIHFVDAMTGWAVGGSDTILHTSDGGANWTAQASGKTVGLWSVQFADANTGWVVGFQGTILHTSDGGANWTAQTSGTKLNLWGMHFVDMAPITAISRALVCNVSDNTRVFKLFPQGRLVSMKALLEPPHSGGAIIGRATVHTSG